MVQWCTSALIQFNFPAQGAHYPQGARRIRKAAKPPTAAQGTPLQTQLVCTFLSAPCTNWKCLPEIATAPLGPRNDKFGGIAPLNLFRNHCQPAWRSLTAATDAIGLYVFIVSLFLALVRSRARLSAPLHFPLRCRKIPPGRVFIPAGM